LQKRIVILTDEMKVAKARHAQQIKEKEERREAVINSKLKQKSSDL
jgi:D-ribose pyranose/furanose isomerase RbsD